MAQNILNDLLNLKLKPEKIVDWLTTDNFNDTEWIDFNKNCRRDEFVSFFLNYLQDQFTGIFQSNNVFKQTPVKKVLAQSQKVNSKELIKTDLESIKSTENIFNDDNQSSNQIECPVSSEQIITSLVYKLNESDTKYADCKNFTYTSISPIKNSVPIDLETRILNINSMSPDMMPQTSTPIIKNKNSFFKRDELIHFNFAQSNHVIKEDLESKQVNSITNNENINFNDKSVPSFEQNISEDSSISNFTANIEKNEFLELYNSNASQKSNFSLSNASLQSSNSLENHALCMLSSLNVKVSENKNNSQTTNSFYQLNKTSTLEKNVNNVHKNFKSIPRQNICLGDFIGTEIKSTKKGSGKKHCIKILSKNGELKHSDKNSILSPSLKHSEFNIRRRKVNPTRLNDTDGKGNKENTVFGVVSRPFTKNPQFINVLPIDKSYDNESFQFERGLVKKERERKFETLKNEYTDIDTNVIDKQNILCTSLPRISYKIKKLNSIIIPDKMLVENKEVLDVLALLYSKLLDCNLVVNPMTELYFIILLITIQYKSVTKLSSTMSKINKKTKNDNVDIINKSNDRQKNLLVLRKSLNFDHMEDKNKKSKEQRNENYQQQNDSDKYKYCNLTDDSKRNINQINKNFRKISLDVSNNEQIMDIKEENSIEKLVMTQTCIKKYFDTPHNCVYFSIQVLNYQRAFLQCLDRVTLKLLCENNQIVKFQPELFKYLDKIYSIKVTESNKIKSLLNTGNLNLNVSFQIDTDNREKFPSAIAFQCFRKQRDMFYEILKIWEDNHLLSGWKFQIALSGKIRTMLTMHADITNFTHFTRLFKSQMLISCIQSEQQDELPDDETLSILKTLRENNPDKLTKLQRKLVTPVSQNGPVPLPSFPGIQEFYKDFILYSSHPMFYTYLENTFVHEIMELNDSQFCGSDIQETETEVDESTKQNFIVCLSSLRLLSKFLGFMTSLPYRSDTSMLEDVISSQIKIRSKCLPRIDLQNCLEIAVIERKLSLTVPWVVEYLGMMDHATLRLPYYKRVLEILYCIYRTSSYHTAINLHLMSQETIVLIKFIIGWLFESTIFPKELYYFWQSKYNNKTLNTICEMQESIIKVKCNFNDIKSYVVSTSEKHCLFLDKLEMIDERILYSCCPFLRELNILLTPGSSSINNGTSCKHITPVTSQLPNSTKMVDIKYLEVQLEEAFFRGQPMSTRKTVEYIAERVSSSCIKYIYNNLLPVEKKINFEILKDFYHENYTITFETNPKLVQTILRNEIDSLLGKTSKNLKEKCEKILPKICESRIRQSIESLLSEDCLQPVKNMCIKIAIRMAMERIDQWIQLHIVKGTIFMKDIDVELNKIMKPYDEVVIEKNLHNPNASSPSNILNGMRNFICDLIETNGNTITIENLCNFCNKLYETLTERSDLKYVSQTTISSLSVDLCLFLITYRNDLFTTEIQEKFFKVWKIDHLKFSNPDSPLSRILSPKNVVLLSQSDNNDVWINFGKFLNTLLKKNILSIDLLSDQAVALFRNEWKTTMTKNLSMCLNEAIKSIRSLDEETEKIRYLLGWIAETYNDMYPESFKF